MDSKTVNGANGARKRSFKLMIVDDSNIMRRRIERSQQFDELGNLYTEWPWQYLDGTAPGRRYDMARAVSYRAIAD